MAKEASAFTAYYQRVKIAVIGGTGHIGSFLLPRLLSAGHTVVNLARGEHQGYGLDLSLTGDVNQIRVDRDLAERDGSFASLVAGLEADVVIDLICFTPESARRLVEGLRGHAGHLIHCGTIWRHGPALRHPMDEDDPSPPQGEYGINKAAIATLLREESGSGGLPTTSLHPGQLVGPGWVPLGPLANRNLDVWRRLAKGDVIEVPGLGGEFMSQVHADDVATAFAAAVELHDSLIGVDINVVASTALSVRGLLTKGAEWFGREPNLLEVSWQEFEKLNTPEDYRSTREHLFRNQYFSIAKAQSLLGYAPVYSPDEAIRESVEWLVESGQLDLN